MMDEDGDLERHFVVAAAALHCADVLLDFAVLGDFLFNEHLWFVTAVGGVFVWTGLLSGIYVCHGTGDWSLQAWIGHVSQAHVVLEAVRGWRGERPELFYTLRLLQAILQSAPMAVLQTYALLLGHVHTGLGTLSVLTSLVSVPVALAMWEHKVVGGGRLYPCLLGAFRLAEVVSRVTTVALFAACAEHGLEVLLAGDYAALVLLLSRQKSVGSAYRVFVAVPLVFVSIEPLVWAKASHAVPKEQYYSLRVAEFLLLFSWLVLTASHEVLYLHRQVAHLALGATVVQYLLLPLVWRMARMQEVGEVACEEEDDDWRDVGQGFDRDYYAPNDPEACFGLNRALQKHAVAHCDDSDE